MTDEYSEQDHIRRIYIAKLVQPEKSTAPYVLCLERRNHISAWEVLTNLSIEYLAGYLRSTMTEEPAAEIVNGIPDHIVATVLDVDVTDLGPAEQSVIERRSGRTLTD
ncbi:hypothetical protein HED60_13970 [Planctomycetales bacterium ZRK34]|nr:hypothetical protein HED60_13970 [Planctomycetales bacterium ZRK34]